MPLRSFSDFIDINVDFRALGLSESLGERVQLLHRLLSRALYAQAGEETYRVYRQLVEQSLELYGQDAGYEVLMERVRSLPVDQMTWILRALAAHFHLVNRSEQQEIARINRQRERVATPDEPRAESIAAAIHDLKEAGYTLEEVQALLSRLEIMPTLTAHPTEARRRTILQKQDRIAQLVDIYFAEDSTPDDRMQAEREIYQQIALFLATSEIRESRLSVYLEVSHGLYFLTNAIWQSVPRLYRDLRRTLTDYYDAPQVELPIVLRYRSWIGGDRDGNPNVTADVTRTTLDRQRNAVIELYVDELNLLRQDLSICGRYVTVDQQLFDSIAADHESLDISEPLAPELELEPFRAKIDLIKMRLEEVTASTNPGAYRAADFINDLKVIRESLASSIHSPIGMCDRLDDLLVHARTFGFHLAALDIRQHSQVHEEAVAELLRIADVTCDYQAMTERNRLALLVGELNNPRPLLPRGAEPSPKTAELLATFATIREALAVCPASIGSYIISMTHEVSDLMEVLLLAKEVGLWTVTADGARCPLDVVPLFETIDDLERGETLMESLFALPTYRQHLKQRGDFQELMLGYSDSNKDGGYFAANWALHQAQARLSSCCRKHNIGHRLFHGRGGTVGRGGGRANAAILALPQESQNGRIRFTEQGEVITFRYAMPDIARRHIEQVIHALLVADVRHRGPSRENPDAEALRSIMHKVSEKSLTTYRQFIRHKSFWPWYTQITPIEFISKLRIASRPVSRKSGSEVDFENLRAIPWVFAWTQTRYNIPGWYGIGTAFAEAAKDEQTLALLRRWHENWPFLRTVLANAELELARTRLPAAAAYTAGFPETIPDLIATEYEQAVSTILSIIDKPRLMERLPVLQRSIRIRNPFTDPLNLMQAELLRRVHDLPEDEAAAARQAIFLSINGIAAAMQSTG